MYFCWKAEQRLQPLALLRIFKQRGLLQAQPVDRLLQVLILLAHMAQVDVVLPEAGNPSLGVRAPPAPAEKRPRWPRSGSAARRGCRRHRAVLRRASVRRTCMASPMICATSTASSTSRLR